MRRYVTVLARQLLFISLALWPMTCFAQDEEVPREFAQEEYISMDRSMKMNDAFAIINELCQKYENKLLIDSKEHSRPIGVMVDNMHWKRALEYILRSNGLSYNEHPRHFEIADESDGGTTKSLGDEISFETGEIEINAIFFEADYSTLNEIGIDWSTLTDGKVKLRVASTAGSDVSRGIFQVQMATEKILNVALLLKAFETKDKGHVLANPQIRIMDGEEGKIKVGKNFFLTTRDFAGNTRYSEYESGTILTVVPHIIKDNEKTFIHLDLKAEKSDVEVTSLGVTKKITEGQTQVLLLDGEETALAGLFSNERSQIRKGIPILKDLPWWFLGVRYLAGFNSASYAKKELIILIKANIVPDLESRFVSKEDKQNYLQLRRKEFYERQKQYIVP